MLLFVSSENSKKNCYKSHKSSKKKYSIEENLNKIINDLYKKFTDEHRFLGLHNTVLNKKTNFNKLR